MPSTQNREPTRDAPNSDAAPDREAPQLSIVIPAFNEAGRLPATLERLAATLRGCDYSTELVIVDDGSTDETGQVAERFRSQGLPLRVLRHAPNRGKGYSVRRGVLESRGAYVLFCDADGSTDFDALPRCLEAAQAGARVVIGSRHLPESRVMRSQPWLRRTMSGGFRWLGQRVLLQPVSDIMCGFKMFEAGAARAIFTQLQLTEWAFDAEVLFLAQLLGLRIVEVPVRWTNDDRSRVKLRMASVQSAIGLLRIRLNALRGRYQMLHIDPPRKLQPAGCCAPSKAVARS